MTKFDRIRPGIYAAAVHRPATGDLMAAGVRRDDHGVSEARASRPQFDGALDALIEGDTLVITTLDRLGRSTQNMLALSDELRARGAGLRVPNLGGGDVDKSTPMGSMLFTVMAALAQMEHEIKRERVTDSISKRREAGNHKPGGWPPQQKRRRRKFTTAAVPYGNGGSAEQRGHPCQGFVDAVRQRHPHEGPGHAQPSGGYLCRRLCAGGVCCAHLRPPWLVRAAARVRGGVRGIVRGPA